MPWTPDKHYLTTHSRQNPNWSLPSPKSPRRCSGEQGCDAMAEEKHIIILANSAWSGKHCVAGKVVTPLPDGKFEFHNQWMRLNCATDSEGAVPYVNTICPNH